MSQIRRRQFSGKAGDTPIEHPDYFYWDFETAEDNVQIGIGYYCKNYLKNVILDGEQYNISTLVNGTSTKMTIPTAGYHTIYVDISETIASASGRFVSAYPKSILRFPYDCVGKNLRMATSTHFVVESLSEIPPSLTSYPWNSALNVDKIYVPVGCASAYKSADGWKDQKTIIEEKDFNYTIPNG